MHINPTTIVRQLLTVPVAMLVTSAVLAGDSTVSATSEMSAAGAWLPVAEFHQDAFTPAKASIRASGIASVLTGSDIPVPESGMALRAFSTTPGFAVFTVKSIDGKPVLTEATPYQTTRDDAPDEDLRSDDEIAVDAKVRFEARNEPAEHIRVLVDTARNATLAIDDEVKNDFASSTDVGALRARALFDKTINDFVERRLVATEQLARGSVRTSQLMQGEQAWGKPARTRVKEYLFEVPHTVGGIEVFGAGTTISVHRSGRLAAVRTVGPTVSASTTKEILQRSLSSAMLEQRARSEYPNAKIIPLGLRYPWQATDDTAVAARPRETFQVVPITEVDGRTISGRSQFVFYSVEDEREDPLVWPKVNP